MRGLRRAVLLAAVLAVSAEGATVHMRDGRKLAGTIVSATARDIELFTGGATMRIPASDILRVDYDESVPPAAAPPTYAPRQDSLWRRTEPFYARRQQLGLSLGLTIPVTDVDFSAVGGGSGANGDVSADVGGHYLYQRTSRLAWGFAVEYLARSGTDSPGVLSNARVRTSGGTVALLGLIKAVLLPHEVVQPYVLGGMGAARTWTVVDARPNRGFVWNDTSTDETRRLIDGRAWTPAGTVRLGLDFWPAAPAVFSLEAGWTGMGGASYKATPQGRAIGLSDVSGALHIVTVGGRWGWRF